MRATDAELVDAGLRGDKRAWEQLVRRYERLVYSIIARHRLEPSDGEDVFQTVFLNLLRTLGSLRDASRLAPWLIRTAYRECWRVKRQSRRLVTAEVDPPDASDPAKSEQTAWERHYVVHEALGRMGAKCRNLLTALFLEDPRPSYRELAERMRMPVGSIGPTRARCFDELRAIVQHLMTPRGF